MRFQECWPISFFLDSPPSALYRGKNRWGRGEFSVRGFFCCSNRSLKSPRFFSHRSEYKIWILEGGGRRKKRKLSSPKREGISGKRRKKEGRETETHDLQRPPKVTFGLCCFLESGQKSSVACKKNERKSSYQPLSLLFLSFEFPFPTTMEAN